VARTVLVAFATNYGSTKEVAEAIASALRNTGAEVDVKPARDVKKLDGYGAVVLGAPLIVGKLQKDARGFLARHEKALKDLPVALFALGPCKEPRDEAEWRDCQGQLDKALAGLGWLTPVATELFGGRFDPALLKFPFNKMAGSQPASDARDWDDIEAWGAGLPARFERSA
jgi:menaquinone-dependent protoporphyrinogen oxidase